AEQTNETADWYRGTADAIRQNLRYLRGERATDVLVLSGDGLYRMDFRQLLATHRETGADATLAVQPVTRAQASAVGVARLDDGSGRTELGEKPQTAEQLEPLRSPADWLARRGLGGGGREYLANTGIYVFKRAVLDDWLRSRPQATDLVTQLLAPSLR